MKSVSSISLLLMHKGPVYRLQDYVLENTLPEPEDTSLASIVSKKRDHIGVCTYAMNQTKEYIALRANKRRCWT